MIGFPTMLKHPATSQSEEQSNVSLETRGHGETNPDTSNSGEGAKRSAPAPSAATKILLGKDGRTKPAQETIGPARQQMHAPPVGSAGLSSERRSSSAEYPGYGAMGSAGLNPLPRFTRQVLPEGQRSIDDLVRELLYPMLKQWLDENLLRVVERLVTKEIERLTER